MTVWHRQPRSVANGASQSGHRSRWLMIKAVLVRLRVQFSKEASAELKSTGSFWARVVCGSMICDSIPKLDVQYEAVRVFCFFVLRDRLWAVGVSRLSPVRRKACMQQIFSHADAADSRTTKVYKTLKTSNQILQFLNSLTVIHNVFKTSKLRLLYVQYRAAQ